MAEKLYSENSKKHNHDMPCPHNLLFCTPCDEVYCTNCEEVFTSNPCSLQHNNWTWTTYPDTIGDVIVTNDVDQEFNTHGV